MLRPAAPLGLLTSLVFVAPSCDASEEAEPLTELEERGRSVYGNRVEDGNSFACATCHAIEEPTDDGLRRPGHPIGDALARPSFKNGRVESFLEAANSCLVEWMNAEPWSEDDEDHRALVAFLERSTPSSAPPLSFEIVQPPPVDRLAGGDAEVGRSDFNATCAVCHGEDGAGTEQGPPLAGRPLDPELVARRVRTSGRMESTTYSGLTGGIMPFWAPDRLGDEELRNIVAFLMSGASGDSGSVGGDSGGDEPDGDSGDDDTPPTGTCAATHPMVGATAELTGYFHDVAGTAEIIDDCTIVLHDFVYDGAGIDVRLYGGLAGDYDSGFPMGDDLVQPGGYQGDTLSFTLPDDKTLDDLDGVSVWCVDVGVDFGSGMFEGP